MDWPQFFQINLVFAILVTLYWLLLDRNKYFGWKRLIMGMIPAFCLIIPQLQQPLQLGQKEVLLDKEFDQAQTYFKTIATVALDSPSDKESLRDNRRLLSLHLVLHVIYFAGVLFFLIRYLSRQLILLKFIYQSEKIKTQDGYWMIHTNKSISPFSFFHFLVPGPQKESPETIDLILQHEKIHARQWHSLDVLLSEWLKIIFWCNPFAYLYGKLLKNNLEYLVDQQMIRMGNSPYVYQYHLLKVGTSHLPFSFTNPYNRSFLKKRIMMINTPHNHRWNLLKTVLFFIAILPMMQLFGQEKVSSKATNEKNIAIIMTSDASIEQLQRLQDDVMKLDMQLLFENLELDADGSIAHIDFTIHRGNGELGSSLSPKKNRELGLLPFTARFISLQARGMGVGGVQLDEIIDHWDDWTLLTAGVNTTKSALKKLALKMQDVQLENNKRWELVPVEKRQNRIGTTTYKTMDEEKMTYAKQRIQQQINEYKLPPTYIVDGLPRRLTLNDFQAEDIESLELITVDKAVNKKGDYQRAEFKVVITRKR